MSRDDEIKNGQAWLAVLVVMLVSIASAALLSACGGGDAEEEDDDRPGRCVIDGLPRPPEACNQ